MVSTDGLQETYMGFSKNPLLLDF